MRTSFLVFSGVLISLFAVGQKARSLQIAEPIHLATSSTFMAGQPLACSVQLTTSPAQVTIYSSPLGAVSYSGSVASSTATVSAKTSPTVTGPITIYLKTDGAQTCSTMATATAGTTSPMTQ
jgi:hypothetical protein